MFGESGFAHGDLLQEHNQYAGRSLNVNGPLYLDAYKPIPLRIRPPTTSFTLRPRPRPER
ncbi:hypothetical protein DMT40_23180 [Klebsiella variicola]|nr:hypothetical protein DMT40_23180 [Klebsiella variicola]